MKILIHAPELSTPGGKQTYFAAVKDYFRSEVDFFYYGAQGKNESKLGVVNRLFSDYRRFYRTLKNDGYEVVHLNPSLNPKSFFRDSIFALICAFLKVKFVVFWHGWQWEFEKKVVQKILPFFRFTYGKADAMILLANEFLNQIKSYGYKNKLYLDTTVVDNKIFQHIAQLHGSQSTVLAGRQSVSEKEINLLFLARVERVKGIYETLDSFQTLKQKYPNLVLNIGGVGGELEAAKAYAKSKGIKAANFLGWITGDQKSNHLAKADIYILASYHGEGMPCSLLEAMASGLAVVTTDMGGIKDFFEDGQMGYFVDQQDTVDLTRQLERLISSPEIMKKMGEFNKSYAKKRFAPEQVSNRLEEIYESVY